MLSVSVNSCSVVKLVQFEIMMEPYEYEKVYTDPIYINKIYEARIRHGYIRRTHNPPIGLKYIYSILVIINTRINSYRFEFVYIS